VTRSALQVTVVVMMLLLLASAAHAVPVPSVPPLPIRRAPAPLLAAGIPAFMALGGGALIGRVVRRGKDNRHTVKP